MTEHTHVAVSGGNLCIYCGDIFNPTPKDTDTQIDAILKELWTVYYDNAKLTAHSDTYFNAKEEAKAALKQLLATECNKKLEKYHELIMAVGNKFEGETRHETALRYITQAENQDNPPALQKEVST